ncbi:MAG: hypothetical protein U0793_24695 [Gemmataceae bacterium]
MPGPPPGFQRPGIPGAGNILDPAVRGEIREQLHDAVHGARRQVQGDAAPQVPPSGTPPTSPPTAPPTAPPDVPAAPPSAVPSRAGPFPHGDIDLSDLPANVPAGPVRPVRGRARNYYFLQNAASPMRDEPPPPAPQTPPGPKPG